MAERLRALVALLDSEILMHINSHRHTQLDMNFLENMFKGLFCFELCVCV